MENTLDAAISELQELKDQLKRFEWQPIETAPKYCYVILFLGTLKRSEVRYKDGLYRVAIWCQDHWSAINEWIGRDLPTHWMPLPTPPNEE